MTLLSPKWLWLALLLVPLVVLYILKVRRKRLAVGSTWLWSQAQRDLMARSPFKRLIVQLPLILQALALVALALAAAMPASSGTNVIGDHIAIIVDTSASMAARDKETQKTRLELAQEAALKIVSGIAPGSDVMIIEAASEARIALPPDRDRRRLTNAIEGLTPRHEEGQLATAISLATSRLGQGGGRSKIVLLSDGALAHPAPLTNNAIDIEFIRVGSPIDNAAIVRVDVRSGEDPVAEKAQVQAFVSLANFGKQPRELYVTLHKHQQQQPLASRRVRVPAGESLPVVLTFYPQPGDAGRGLRFELSPGDDMAVDDVAYGRIPAGRSLPVYLASAAEPSPWLLRALVSDSQAAVRKVSMAELLASDIPSDALVVMDGACMEGAPGGELLIVNPPAGECYGTKVGATIDKPLITSWEQSDSRMRFLTLDGVYLSQGHLLIPESKRQTLITSDKGIIAVDASDPRRGITMLGFDVGDSNWPLRASFVLFVRNVMERARRHRSRSAGVGARAGKPLRITLPAKVKQITVSGPDDFSATHAVRDGLAIIPHVATTGLYRLHWEKPSAGEIWLPVNLTSKQESDLTKEPVDSARPNAEIPSHREPLESHQRHSWLLALFALAMLLLDIWWLTRTPRSHHATRTVTPPRQGTTR